MKCFATVCLVEGALIIFDLQLNYKHILQVMSPRQKKLKLSVQCKLNYVLENL